DLSVSLDNVGGVARAQGDWSQAEAVYRESLALSRQLVERLGATPDSLRDLSVSLNNVGGVARAQGDWSQAEAVYRESLALRRQLVERLGATPESLRDLSVSLTNVANVEQQHGTRDHEREALVEAAGLLRRRAALLNGVAAVEAVFPEVLLRLAELDAAQASDLLREARAAVAFLPEADREAWAARIDAASQGSASHASG
uniref:tetratricopeptide repeat protein n=1 Tax=Methyloversatilis sp. TaxID=2569862 RepID=UPI0035B4F5C7